jgi:hypothetical protein
MLSYFQSPRVERNRLTPVAHVIDGGFSEKMFPAVFVSFISIHKLSVLLLDIFNLDRDFVYSYHNSSLLFMFVGSRYDVVRIINKGPALLLSFFRSSFLTKCVIIIEVV